MKKIILGIQLIILAFMATSIRTFAAENEDVVMVSAMGTTITVYVKENIDAQTKQEIKDVYNKYHILTNNYVDEEAGNCYTGDYLENICSINQKAGEKIKIDRELYDLFVLADTYKALSNGYFDISVGRLINAWKHVIFENLAKEISKETWDQLMETLQGITVHEKAYVLSVEDNAYYIQTKEDVILDLGALAKGYATQKVYDLLKEKGLKYFYINAGQSSIALAQNNDQDQDTYRVNIRNPIGDNYLGYTYIKDNGVTTSASTYQYFMYQGKRYQHIVSPITKMSETYYLGLTMIGSDLAYADAMTTAMMSMDEASLDAFYQNEQANHPFEMYVIKSDESIIKYLKETQVIFNEPKADKNHIVIIALLGVIAVGGGLLAFDLIRKKRKGTHHE